MGMLAPLDACVSAHAEFANVRQDAWLAAPVRGQVWGVPVAADTDTLFFSKTLLRRMGWSEARIGDLPQQILEGAFTRDDMRRTAEDAVRRGIVRPGFGVWEDQDRVWDVKTPRRDARISARVLFWYWNNRAWGEDLLKLGGPDKFEWLYNNMGYALPPADKADAKPASLRAASYKVFYVITADKANGIIVIT